MSDDTKTPAGRILYDTAKGEAVMTDRPIIMSAPMVQALLTGRKTQTRRLVTPRTCAFGSIRKGALTKLYWEHANWGEAWVDRGVPDPATGCRWTRGYLHVPCHADEAEIRCLTCDELGWAGTAHRLYPRVVPGDRLWVKETWAEAHPLQFQDGRELGPHLSAGIPGPPPVDYRVAYRADGELLPIWHSDNGHPYRQLEPRDSIDAKHFPKGVETGWVSSLFMPRAASRLTLAVTATRIERLQEIDTSDVSREGLRADDPLDVRLRQHPVAAPMTWNNGEDYTAVAAFRRLWTKLHGEESWAANPYVVVISFAVEQRNIDDTGA